MSIYTGVTFKIQIVPATYYYKVTDIFGIRKWRKERFGGEGMHKGIDLGTPIGTKIKSPYNGTVVDVSYAVKKAGNILKIKHADGFETRYLHLHKINVKKGDIVESGQVVALTGNSDGDSNHSTGPHLHFEVIENGTQVDPAPYLYGYALKDGEIKDGKQYFIKDETVKFSKELTLSVKIDNVDISKKQIDNAQKIIDVCKKLNISKRDAIITINVALTESKLLGLNYGESNSAGIFQKKTTDGWGNSSELNDIDYSTQVFLKGVNNNKGLLSIEARDSKSVSGICREVQINNNKSYEKYENASSQIVDFLWDSVDSFLNVYATELSFEDIKEEIKIEEYLAAGIWQIIKVVIDPEVIDKQINDASIAFNQGSLYNFFEKVCQKPFVEFWGDTYGDQYYFIIRKPPFTRKAYNSLTKIEIDDRDVISDSLSWSNDSIYSWYQLIPNGNYIGANEALYSYIRAVFFPEYAEIWGSRPLSITSNYITFIKETDTVQMQAVIEDLKFLIDIHSYLPFTRQGTITINGDRRIKRGMRIHYLPTDEYYYVDAVSNNFRVTEGVPERITTLQVSRGMVAYNAELEIEDETTPSYFNLINYGDNLYLGKKNSDSVAKETQSIPKINRHVAYFNQDKHTFSIDDIGDDIGLQINSGEIYLGANRINSTEELKITKAILNDNHENCKKIAKVAQEYKSLTFKIYGGTDSVDTRFYNFNLGERRARTIRDLIIQYYKEFYSPTKEEVNALRKRFEIVAKGETYSKSTNNTPIGRLKNRVVTIIVNEKNKNDFNENKDKKVESPEKGNWHVNKEVFTYFMKRLQFSNATTKGFF
jgi:hypothetical protein